MAIWKSRKSAFGAIGRLSPTFCTQDGVVPRTKLPHILRFITAVGERHDIRIANVFHAGDGNIHPILLFDERDPDQVRRVLEASHEILEECINVGGSVTGEHGIGVEKMSFMPKLFSPEDLAAMVALRTAFNPDRPLLAREDDPRRRGMHRTQVARSPGVGLARNLGGPKHMATVPRRPAPRPVHYPESDGKPMAETPYHGDNLSGLIQMLRERYRDDPTTYVSGNNFLYFVEGDPKKNVSPDVFLVHGVEPRYRPIYCTWLEGGKAPDLIIELTSPKTKKEDAVKKFLIYQDILRVREYFLFDPLDEYLKPRLQGHRLIEGRYIPIEPDEAGRLHSEVTGLQLFPDGFDLKLFDPRTGEVYLTLAERVAERLQFQREREEQARQVEIERQRAEEQSRQAAEARAEVERLRMEIESLRKGRPEAE